MASLLTRIFLGSLLTTAVFGSAMLSVGCGSESSETPARSSVDSMDGASENSVDSSSAAGSASVEAAADQVTQAASDAVDQAATAAAAAANSEGVMIDPELPAYDPEGRVSGSVKFAGSDTMTNLVALWIGTFNREHPAVKPQAEAKGSATAPPALIEGQAQFGAMSRAMKPEEIQKFSERFGYEPTQLKVAIDAIGVFVNKDNPIESLTLGQLQQVFSVTGGDLTWGDLGVTDPDWVNLPVSMYGRNEASGTYAFFQKAALGGADYKPTVKAQPGSAGVVNAISTDRGGLGYSGLGYRTADVRILPIAIDEFEPAIEPEVVSVSSGEYPLARFLYMYLRYDRREPLDALRAEFVRLVFSRDGQESVVQDGVYPVSAALAREQLRVVGLEPGF